MTKEGSDVGLIGLAVMGQNLALNIADHGYSISVYNRTTSKTDIFIKNNPSYGDKLHGLKSLKEFVGSLKKPRKILLLVKAGKGTDAIIDELTPLVERGDILIDCGNAFWLDTIRREKELTEKGIHFIGSGISGGEEGARKGPSLMPAGSKEAWEGIKPIWEAIAAKVELATGKPVDSKSHIGSEAVFPCTAYIGSDGAGHYVKMVHNGIEYADMQMICEVYHILKSILQLNYEEMAAIFETWNKGPLESFLIEITADILKTKDPLTQEAFVEKVRDVAGQKGTGKWTAINALELGVPSPTLAEAVFARYASSLKKGRLEAAALYGNEQSYSYQGDKTSFIQSLEKTLYAAKICAYAQGFQLMSEAQKEYNWQLNFAQIAQIWRGGCIIRARLLQKITEAFEKGSPTLSNLILDPYFKNVLESAKADWRKVVQISAGACVPIPCIASALAYFDSSKSAWLPHNLLQAQRDYFGAHTFERTDAPEGQLFHLDWQNPKRPLVEV